MKRLSTFSFPPKSKQFTVNQTFKGPFKTQIPSNCLQNHQSLYIQRAEDLGKTRLKAADPLVITNITIMTKMQIVAKAFVETCCLSRKLTTVSPPVKKLHRGDDLDGHDDYIIKLSSFSVI